MLADCQAYLLLIAARELDPDLNAADEIGRINSVSVQFSG